MQFTTKHVATTRKALAAKRILLVCLTVSDLLVETAHTNIKITRLPGCSIQHKSLRTYRMLWPVSQCDAVTCLNLPSEREYLRG